MNQVKKNNKGFTIIEVVLVLAIAGLIFLMVFVALPALQRNQRDTARKSDVATISAAVTTYTGNNRGDFPNDTSFESYWADEVSENITDVIIEDEAVDEVSPDEGVIVVIPATTCGDSSPDSQALVSANAARQYTVVTKLEAGSGAYFCQSN